MRLLGLTIGLAGGLADGLLTRFLPISFARFLARFPNGLLAELAELTELAADELPEEIIFLVAATLYLSKSILPLC